MKTLVIIPAYNEEKMIGTVVKTARKYLPKAEILVVDDGSADRTGEIAREAGAKTWTHYMNLGYGQALKTGYRYASVNGFSRVAQMDADGQHDPAFLPDLLWTLRRQKADVVVGSRFCPGAKRYSIPFFRRTGMLFFSRVAEAKTGIHLTDTTSGFRAFSRRAVELCIAEKWKFPDANLLIQLHKSGMKIIEVPVTMYEGQKGKSMHSGILKPITYTAYMLRCVLGGTA